ncbi:hypothetical protein [Allohahella sp. A8]|uniref:hypothetical protein n=1 Tax=Allohahella sp. A8 TaxID=3141461 RepID=UPI000C09616E|nr:hypothetical protein [Hahellaceae bacterium]|tara:strand:+ start:17156 stop:17344 length:189 start_codon:yes stop_codon:yes gene_type:complete
MITAYSDLFRIVLSASVLMLAIEYLWTGHMLTAWVYVAISAGFGLFLLFQRRPFVEDDPDGD